MGYGYIAAPHAAAMEAFYEQHFNPYLNFDRPCGVPESVVDHKGKVKKKYGWYATPWEILRQLRDLASHLNPAVTIEELDWRASAKTDTEAAREYAFSPGSQTPGQQADKGKAGFENVHVDLLFACNACSKLLYSDDRLNSMGE